MPQKDIAVEAHCVGVVELNAIELAWRVEQIVAECEAVHGFALEAFCLHPAVSGYVIHDVTADLNIVSGATAREVYDLNPIRVPIETPALTLRTVGPAPRHSVDFVERDNGLA